jgi:hypothetical protein
MRSRRLTKLLVGTLATLTGCGWGAVPLYGVEVAEFTYRGHVVDAETGVGIPDIQLRFGGDEQLSDAGGAWELTGNAARDCEPGTCSVEARDLDGDANGAYQAAEVELLAGDAAHADDNDVLIELQPIFDTGGAL